MSVVNDIYNEYGEKWANYIFALFLNNERLLKHMLLTSEVFLNLSYSSYFTMLAVGKCPNIRTLPDGEKRELWEASKEWMPDCAGKEIRKKIVYIIHLLLTIGQNKQYELLPSPTKEKS